MLMHIDVNSFNLTLVKDLNNNYTTCRLVCRISRVVNGRLEESYVYETTLKRLQKSYKHSQIIRGVMEN